MVTGFYAALLALWLVVLSLRVIALRGSPVFAFLGEVDVSEEKLERAVRGHGNLTEYAPTLLILLFLLEQGGASTAFLHALGVTFLVGRVAHGICFAFMERSALLRIGGMVLTLTAILGGAIAVLMNLQ